MEIPILYSVEGQYPIVLSSVTLVYDSSFVNERTLPVLLYGDPHRTLHQESNTPKQRSLSAPLNHLGSLEKDLLYSRTKEIGRHCRNSSHKRFMNSSKRAQSSSAIALLQSRDILVPPKLKETVQQHGYNMFLSTGFFSPQIDPAALTEKIRNSAHIGSNTRSRK